MTPGTATARRADSRSIEQLLRLVRHEELAARTVRVTFAAALAGVDKSVAGAADRRRRTLGEWRDWARAAVHAHAEAVRRATQGRMDGADPDGRLAEALRRFEAELVTARRVIGG